MQKLKDFIRRHFEGSLLALIFVGILIIAFLVHYKFAFLNIFFLPVILSGYFLGKRRAVLTAVFCVLVVVLYLLLTEMFFGTKGFFTFDNVINLIAWGSILILTAAVIGSISEQREAKLRNLRNAYVGVLEIMLRYLESADEIPPHSLRVAQLAGRIAAAAGLDRREVENIKSAVLLSAAGDPETSLPLFVEMTEFLSSEGRGDESWLGDREKVLLKSTASLLKEAEPLLSQYQKHYVAEAARLDKDLEKVSQECAIMALAHIYEHIAIKAPPFQEIKEFQSLTEVQRLAGRTFPAEAVDALMDVVGSQPG